MRGSQVAMRNSGSFPPYYAGARPLSARDQSVARFLLHLTTRTYACDQTLPFAKGLVPRLYIYHVTNVIKATMVNKDSPLS